MTTAPPQPQTSILGPQNIRTVRADLAVRPRRDDADRRAARDVVYSAAWCGEHSRKPEKSYEIIEAASPGARLELFARRERPVWLVWGDEVDI